MQGSQDKFVEIKVVTWNKDSHGLFDYESKNINVKKCKIEQPCQIIRKKIINGEKEESEVEFTDIDQQLNEEQQTNYMTSVIAGNSSSFIANPSIVYQGNNANQDNFLIVRSLKNKEGQQKGYELQPGDVVKLGRIEYLVHEINDGNNTNKVANYPQSEFHHIYTVKEEELNQSRMDCSVVGEEQPPKQCKICLMEDQSEENFLISPCDCKGSCQYVHFMCLKTWVESKIKKKQNNNTVSYSWKKSECELCGKPLPKKIKNRSEELELVDIERPAGVPYLLLESLAKDKKVSKNLFMINAVSEEDKVCLGRGHQCEVRISDISVSRQHAFIKFMNGKFVITDNNSKFGTLIKLKDPIPVTYDKVAIQVGRTVITFVIKSEKEIEQAKLKQQQLQAGSSSTIGSQNNLNLNKGQSLQENGQVQINALNKQPPSKK